MKVFNLSYLLYPLVGTSVTIIVGMVVSLLTGKQSDGKIFCAAHNTLV